MNNKNRQKFFGTLGMVMSIFIASCVSPNRAQSSPHSPNATGKVMSSQSESSDKQRLQAFFSQYFQARLRVAQQVTKRRRAVDAQDAVIAAGNKTGQNMPLPESARDLYRREVFPHFCEGVSVCNGFQGSDPNAIDDAEFNYLNWDMTGYKKAGDIWIVEHKNIRGKLDRGYTFQHKLRELPDGTFRLIGERWKGRGEGDKFVNLEL